MMDFPKTYTRNRHFFSSSFIPAATGLLAIILALTLLFSLLMQYHRDTLFIIIVSGFVLGGIGLVVYFPLRETFTLWPDRLAFSSLVRKVEIPFSNTEIWFYPILERGYLLREGKKHFSLNELPGGMLLDFFAVLPASMRMLVKPHFEDAEPTTPDDYAEAKLAAQAFRYLDCDNLLKALIARQILVFLLRKDPGYVSPSDDARKISEWKNWLVAEYGELIEAYAYQLERGFVKQCLYYFTLPAVLLMICWFAQSVVVVGLGIFIMFVCCIGPVLDKLNLMLQHKRIAKSMRQWSFRS